MDKNILWIGIKNYDRFMNKKYLYVYSVYCICIFFNMYMFMCFVVFKILIMFVLN